MRSFLLASALLSVYAWSSQQPTTVQWTGSPMVSISPSPIAVVLSISPTVTISGTPTVSISGVPSVIISGTPTVSISPSPLPVASQGKTLVTHVRNSYSGVNVTTSAYVQLIASTSGVINEAEIFDSSGQTLVLATGGAGVETDQIYITPGGNGRVPILIPASTRVSIKAVTGTASAGEFDANFYQ